MSVERDLTKHVADIEEFMGHEFGQEPEIKELNVENFMPIMDYVLPNYSLVIKAFLAVEKCALAEECYFPPFHSILLPENSGSRCVSHELVHAYTNNHWPSLFPDNTHGENESLPKKMLTEGLAEYISVGGVNAKWFYGNVLMGFAGKKLFRQLKEKDIKRKTIEMHEKNDRGELSDSPEELYAFGGLLCATVLEGTENKHDAYEQLIMNVPYDIDILISLIDPTTYKIFM